VSGIFDPSSRLAHSWQQLSPFISLGNPTLTGGPSFTYFGTGHFSLRNFAVAGAINIPNTLFSPFSLAFLPSEHQPREVSGTLRPTSKLSADPK
jgi:hypothetical protein